MESAISAISGGKPLPGIDVKAHTHHHIVQLPRFQIEGAFGENAAYLFALQENVIDPFDLRLLLGDGFNGLTGSQCGHGGNPGGMLGCLPGTQQQHQIQSRIRRGIEVPPQSAPSGGLLVGKNDQTLRRASGSPLPHHGIGGGDTVLNFRLAAYAVFIEIGCQPGKGELVLIRAQAVAPVADGARML